MKNLHRAVSALLAGVAFAVIVLLGVELAVVGPATAAPVAARHHHHHHHHRLPLGVLCQYGYRKVIHYGGHPRHPEWAYCIKERDVRLP